MRRRGQETSTFARWQAALDAYRSGRVDRRTVLRYAAMMGMGSVVAPFAARTQAQARASTAPLQQTSAPPVRSDATAGALLRIGNLTPVAAVDPITASDPATICLLSQTCEYLLDDDAQTLTLRPSLALAWSANEDGSVWTFQLRTDVRFHNGRPMRAADVVAVFDRLTDPHIGSAALSVFRGVLSKGGTRARDEHTIDFHLDAPTAQFPYFVSSDNYNAAIVPTESLQGVPYERHFIGTGPFRLASYTPHVGATFVRNPDYWGTPALPSTLHFIFYADQTSQILALEGGDVDLIVNLSLPAARGLLRDAAFRVQSVRSSSHRQLHMRCDAGPFADVRLRRALALSIDRQSLVDGLFLGHAQLGNDSPFAPVFPSSPPPGSVPQRRQDRREAVLLREAATAQRHASTSSLVTERFMEMPDYAVLVQNAARDIGLPLRLRIETQSAYYGAAVQGSSDWLDATIGITDYAHRGVPNVFLSATLTSTGTWNAARFKNATYDRLVGQYAAAMDLEAQERAAVQIARLLQEETPMIIAYFFDAMIAMRRQVRDVQFTAMTQLNLAQAWLDKTSPTSS